MIEINRGIAFSLLVAGFIFWPVWILVLIFLLYQVVSNYHGKLFLPWGLILIGALSNILDRINVGGVVDFIRLPYFTVINFSDLYIFVGVVYLLFLVFWGHNLDGKSRRV